MNGATSYSLIDRLLKSSPMALGAVILLGWFVWHGLTVNPYGLEEWLLFYVIALLCWQPAAAWLAAGVRWIPAAELFFLLHLPYYINPFIFANENFIKVETGTRFQIGLVIALFLLACRWFYRIPRRFLRRPVPNDVRQSRVFRSSARTRVQSYPAPRQLQGVVSGQGQRRKSFLRSDLGSTLAQLLNCKLDLRKGTQLAWWGLSAWFLYTVSLQQGWLPDFGSFFGVVRALLKALGYIGAFFLFYELGCHRLRRTSAKFLIAIMGVGLLVDFASGFLVGGVIHAAIACMAFFVGRKKLPLMGTLVLALALAFLHAGKGAMRAQFWGEGTSYSSVSHSPLDIYLFWIDASWNKIMTAADSGEEVPSLLERGSLLQYLSRVVTDTPKMLPYLGGVTYWQTVEIFVPMFLWPDKPRSSTPDETLAIYYGFQTTESVNITAIGLGKISEGWANFGWGGVFAAGAVMGLILRIPTRLSAGFSPLHFRFLLAVPFISFAMNLEACLGPAVHALSHAFVFSFACLWMASSLAAQRQEFRWVKRVHSRPYVVDQSEVPLGRSDGCL